MHVVVAMGDGGGGVVEMRGGRDGYWWWCPVWGKSHLHAGLTFYPSRS